MPAKSLTRDAVEAARPKSNGKGDKVRSELKDAKVPGLRLVVQPSGAKSWAFRYVVGGRDRKLTLGAYPELNLDQARQRGSTARGEVLNGRDPAGDKMEARHSATTVRVVWEEYRDLHMTQRRDSTSAAALTLFTNDVLPKWGDLGIESIRRRDVMNLLDGMRGEPAKANKAKVRLNHFFGWAVEREIIDTSPVANVKTPNKLKSRDRVLTDDEIRRVWKAADEAAYPFGHIVKALLLTMARRTEVAAMPWAELNDTLWSIDGARTKNGIALDVHRTEALDAVIGGCPRVDGCDFVFSTRENRPVSGFAKMKERLDELIGEGMVAWTLHDLRRTGSTIMQRLGIRKEVIDAAQNHKMPGISATYLRYGYAKEKVQAFEALAAELDRIVSGRIDSNVVPLTRPGG